MEHNGGIFDTSPENDRASPNVKTPFCISMSLDSEPLGIRGCWVFRQAGRHQNFGRWRQNVDA